jgi:c-di-GMP-binding flagellar brake protein YcgR
MILDLNKVSKYLEDIAYGFDSDPIDLVIVIIIILLFLAFLFSIYIFKRNKKRKAQREQSEKRFRRQAETAGLTSEEYHLAEELARTVSPEGYRKHTVLANQATFNAAAEKLDPQEEETRRLLRSLQLKLNFRSHTEQVVRSTTELQPGQNLYILPSLSKSGLQARVSEQSVDGLHMHLQAGRTINENTAVKVYFHRWTGVFLFTSRVISSSDGTIVLEHSDEIKRVQRRNYYRKRVRRPVELWKPGQEQAWKLRGYLHDLGGGGASIDVAPEKGAQGHVFEDGQRFDLRLLLDDQNHVHISGKIVRISHKGKRLHFEFDTVREPQRDKIVKFVLNI